MQRAHENTPPRLRLVRTETPVLPSAAGSRDAVLAAAVLRGDDRARRELVRREAAVLFALERRYARVPDDAGRLVERVFVRAFRVARRTLQGDPERDVPFRRWLLSLATKLSRRHLFDEVCMTRARLDELGPREAAPPTRVAPHPDPAARVRREVLLLPRRVREVLTLRLDAGLSFPEIAQCLGITEEAAVVNFCSAARRLRDASGGGRAARDSCSRYEVLLALLAAGALDRADRARVEAHLAGCDPCSRAVDATEEALACAALPPANEAEQAALERLPARALAALDRADFRRTARMPVGISVAVALGVLAGAAMLARCAGWLPPAP